VFQVTRVWIFVGAWLGVSLTAPAYAQFGDNMPVGGHKRDHCNPNLPEDCGSPYMPGAAVRTSAQVMDDDPAYDCGATQCLLLTNNSNTKIEYLFVRARPTKDKDGWVWIKYPVRVTLPRGDTTVWYKPPDVECETVVQAQFRPRGEKSALTEPLALNICKQDESGKPLPARFCLHYRSMGEHDAPPKCDAPLASRTKELVIASARPEAARQPER
jgi:hypothetical protein